MSPPPPPPPFLCTQTPSSTTCPPPDCAQLQKLPPRAEHTDSLFISLARLLSPLSLALSLSHCRRVLLLFLLLLLAPELTHSLASDSNDHFEIRPPHKHSLPFSYPHHQDPSTLSISESITDAVPFPLEPQVSRWGRVPPRLCYFVVCCCCCC